MDLSLSKMIQQRKQSGSLIQPLLSLLVSQHISHLTCTTG